MAIAKDLFSDKISGDSFSATDANSIKNKVYEVIDEVIPTSTLTTGDTITLNMDEHRSAVTAYTPTGNVTIAVGTLANRVEFAKAAFRLVMDGSLSVTITGTNVKMLNIVSGEILSAGTYLVIAEHLAGETIINFPDNVNVGFA